MSAVDRGREHRCGHAPGRVRSKSRIGRIPAAACAALALLAVAPPVAAQIEGLFALLDANGDGVIDPQEFQLRKTEVFFRSVRDMDAAMTLGPEDTNLTSEAFAEADLDSDGRLSGAEFVQARFAQFELYDADSDQSITSAEFEGFISEFLSD